MLENCAEKDETAEDLGGFTRSIFEQPRSLLIVQITPSIYHVLNIVKEFKS